MQITIEIRRLNELIAAYERAPDAVKRELKLAMRVALRDIQRRARSEHRFRTRSGNLERDITTQILQEWPVKGRIAIDPAATKITKGRWAGWSYGVFLHDGTKDHMVQPTEKKALRWVGSNGKFWFSRGHKVTGIKSDPFIYDAGKNERANINATFNRYTELALQKAGI